MVLVVKDRIKDTTTTTGTGTITLANSPPNGFQAFSTLGNNSTTYYGIQDANNAFEIGLGTYNANTLTRTTVLASSNSNNLVSLTSPSSVWVDYPASKAYLSDEGIDKSFTATASITAGKPVILNSAGTVTQVVESTTSSYVLGTKQTVLSNSASMYLSYHGHSIAYDSTSGAVMSVYRATTTQYPTVIAGQYTSSGQITWGTPTVVKSTGGSMYPSIVSGGGKFHITYSYDGSSNVYARWATASGTTITLGNETALNSNSTWGYPVAIWCSDISRLLVAFGNYNQTQAYANILDVTATAYTVSSVIGINTNSNTLELVASSLTFDSSTNRVLFTYRSSTQFFAKVLTVTTSSISVGTQQLVTDERAGEIATTYDSNINRIIFRYNAGSGSSPSTTGVNFRVIGITGGSTNTISVTSATFSGYSDAFNNKGTGFVFNSDDNITYVFLKSLAKPLTQIPLTSTVSGVTVGTGIEIGSVINSLSYRISSTFNSTKNAVVTVFTEPSGTSYDLFSSSYYKNSVTTSNLTPTNYLGVASTSASANASVNINIPGSINNDQTSLTVGEYYYTSGNGVISTTLSSNFIGRAISSTQLLLEEEAGNSIVGFSNGAITKGKPVVIQADGDVAQAGQVNVTNTGTASQGSLANIGTYYSDMFSMAVAKDGLTYCFTYQNSSSQQACKIGTRSGETISWGSEVVLASVNSSSHFVSYNASENVFITSYNTGDFIKGTAVSFSGNTGTKGSEVTFMNLGGSSSSSYHYQHWYDSTNEVTVCWAKGGVSGNDTNRSSAVALTVTGTSISVGTLYENTSAGGQYAKGCDITGGKHVVYWRNSSQYPSTMIMTVTSSGAISWGTAFVINSATGGFSNPIYNPNYPNKVIIAGKILTSNNYYSYAGFNISGTSISNANFYSGGINSAQSYIETGGNMGVYSSYSGNYCFVYQTYSPYNSRYNFATTTDGLSLTVATAVTTTAHGSNQFYAGACASDVDGVVVENHNDRSSSTYYSYYCFNPTFNYTSLGPTNLTTENYLGVASDTVADNKNVLIDTQGATNPDQSSLTPAQLYYVQTNGTLSTTAGSPSVVAGIATSATTLLITRS